MPNGKERQNDNILPYPQKADNLFGQLRLVYRNN